VIQNQIMHTEQFGGNFRLDLRQRIAIGNH